MAAILMLVLNLSLAAGKRLLAAGWWLLTSAIMVATDTVVDPLALDPRDSGPVGTIRPHGIAQILIGGLLAVIVAFAPPTVDAIWHRVVGVIVSYRVLGVLAFLGGCLFQGIRIFRHHGHSFPIVKP